MPSREAETRRGEKTPSFPGAVFSWQGGVFAASVLIGVFLYWIYPESPVTRGEVPPLTLYSEGLRMARLAFSIPRNDRRKLRLLLGARLYLDVLLRSRPDLKGTKEVHLVLGRVYFELGDLAAKAPQLGRFEDLLPPGDYFEKAAPLLRKAADIFPPATSRGDEARVFLARTLLALDRAQEVLQILEPVIQKARLGKAARLAEERFEVLPRQARAGLGPWAEQALLIHVATLTELGRLADAAASALEFAPALSDPANEQAMIELGLRAAIRSGDRDAAGRLLGLLEKPILPRYARAVAAGMLFAGRPEDTLSLLRSIHKSALPRRFRTLIEAAALLETGRPESALSLLEDLPEKTLSPFQKTLRLFLLAASSAALSRPSEAADLFTRAAPAIKTVPLRSEILGFLLAPSRLRSFVEETAGLFMKEGSPEKAADFYAFFSRVLPAPDRDTLEKAAFLYEKAAPSNPSLWAKAASALESILSTHPAGKYMENTLWRCLDDWRNAGAPLRMILLCRKTYSETPTIESAPKLLFTLSTLLEDIGLLEEALSYIDKLTMVYPRSTFAIEGRLQKARIQAEAGRFRQARKGYLEILSDARIGPDSLVYLKAIHELGLLEARRLEASLDGRTPPDAALYAASGKHLVEAIERYAAPRFRTYPAFREYLFGKPAARTKVWRALVRRELLAAPFFKGPEAFLRVLELLDAARKDLGMPDRDTEGRFKMYEGTAALMAYLSGGKEDPELIRRAQRAFSEVSERYQGRPDGLFGKVGTYLAMLEMNAPRDELDRALQDARWAVQPLSEEDKAKAGFLLDTLAWLGKLTGSKEGTGE